MVLFTPQTERYLSDLVIPLRLACVSASGWPVVVSLWYAYREGHLYCATQATARVVSYLRHEPRCAFEVAADQPPYCGVRGRGLARIDAASGADTLRELLVRYVGSTDNPLARRLLAQSQHEVTIVIEPVKVFTWDYSSRMRDSAPGQPSKLCP